MSTYPSLSFNGNSQMFDEFLKVAKETSMVKLYDVEPSEDKTGKELIEQAHPEKAEVLESYLVDGGLVENQTEQQETNISSTNRNPSGRVCKKVMAEKELADELIIIAEEMDIRGEDSLSIYADKLLDRLHKEATPLLGIPLVYWAGTTAISAIFGGLFYLAHGTDPVSFGVDKDIQSLIIAIKEYKDKKPTQMTGPDVLGELDTIAVGIYKTREAYKSLMANYENKLKSITSVPKSKDELQNIKPEDMTAISQSKEAKDIINKINEYNSKYNQYISDMLPELVKTKDFLTDYFKQTRDQATDDTGERGFWQHVYDKTTGFFSGWGKQVEDNILDALNVVIKSLAMDLKLRTKEKDQLVSMLAPKIKYDLTEQFKEKEPTTISV